MKACISRSFPVFHFMLAILATVTWSESVCAGGDAGAGAKLSFYCAYCHGADGNPIAGEAACLAGQSEKTLVSRMKAYRQTHFQDWSSMMMVAFITAGCLDDQDIENLAAYFSKQPILERCRSSDVAARK
jgi:cytochrome c553